MRELEILDLFCGAGGTSTGAIEAAEACGFAPTLTAINHWDVAIETHTRNHPRARHRCTGIDQVNARELYRGRQLGVLWASPECTHHSVARGGKPINDQSRATAWCVAKFADQLMPPIILVENVPEFQTWGPLRRVGVLKKDGTRKHEWQPIKERKGEIFRAWVASLEALGYRVEWRVLCAADYGDPTTRRRLFVQAVRGRRKIVWPTPTHGPGLKPYVAAREIIDWSIKGRWIDEMKPQARYGGLPLSPNSLRRIQKGFFQFGLKKFLIESSHGNGRELNGDNRRVHSIDEPVGAVPCTNRFALAEAFLCCMEHGGPARSLDRPMPTITCAKGGAIALAEPFLIELRGTSERQLDATARSIHSPLSTVSAGGIHAALIEAALLPQQSDGRLRPVSEPVPTVAAAGAIALLEPYLVEYYGTGQAQSIDDPLSTVTTKERHALVSPIVQIDGARFRVRYRYRMLKAHELALAQGFHGNYIFAGNKTEQVKQIGNAVPRRLARALLIAALSQKADVSTLIADE